MKYKFATFAFLPVVVLIMAATYTNSDNWPQFRGAESNMAAYGKNLPEKWGIDTNVVWKYKIAGNGWSSPIVWDNKVIILSVFPEKVKEQPKMPEGPPLGNNRRPDSVQGPRTGQSPPVQPGNEMKDTSFKQEIYRWEVACIDLKSGKELWKQVALKGSPKIAKHAMTNYAPETPVTDGKRIYAYFGMTGLFCYDMSGKLLWKKDLGGFETRNGWGTGSSPVLYKDVLYIQVDNEVKSFVVAIDAATGNEKWKTDRDEKTNYSTPFIWKNSVRNELVLGGKITRSYDLNTGKQLWELNTGGDQSVPSAVANEKYLYVGNEGRQVKTNFYAIKAGSQGDITPKEGMQTSSGVEWALPDAGVGKSSPLLYQGFIYIVGGRGEITCIEAASGKVVYKDKISGSGGVWSSAWAFNDKIFVLDEKGVTHVINAGEKFELLYSNKLNDKFWASVAMTDNSIVFRGVEQVFCVKK
jgi:hypothetical protein